ncbi:hypothetical protein [Microtetraspora fusca]|uniref:Uncharacterized protein n=1 Tax=Microtetraspora fusca TaxID=1997 RepID=A0ABW6VH35_MICFU|nr:hypothetical protein [Microtetraspora fusca]
MWSTGQARSGHTQGTPTLAKHGQTLDRFAWFTTATAWVETELKAGQPRHGGLERLLALDAAEAYRRIERTFDVVGVPLLPQSHRVINMIVGDTQRIAEYPKQGFAIPQEMPAEVELAFKRLVDAGYTSRLI